MADHHLLLLLFITSSLFPFLTASDQIPIGASIIAAETSEPWRSPSKDFAFGFGRPFTQNNSFLLSIWFAKTSPLTLAWFDRYPAEPGANLTLESQNGLVLRDSQGKLLHKYTDNLAGQVAYAALTDSGNLILSRNDSNDSLWESFNYPADTILPGQTFGVGNGTLISKKSLTDFMYGRFFAGLNKDGKFALTTKSLPTNLNIDAEYYNAGPGSSTRVQFTDKNSPAILVGNTVILSSNLSRTDYYFKATIEFDGTFSLYHYPKKSNTSSQWDSSGSTLPENICMAITGDKGSGACGYNNVCSLKDDKRPNCTCPHGFELVDLNNKYGDCRSNFSGDCLGRAGPEDYKLVAVHDVDWPLNDYEQMYLSTKEACSEACLKDYLCGAAIYRSDSCWKKRLPLSNGRVDKNLNAVAFLKIRK